MENQTWQTATALADALMRIAQNQNLNLNPNQPQQSIVTPPMQQLPERISQIPLMNNSIFSGLGTVSGMLPGLNELPATSPHNLHIDLVKNQMQNSIPSSIRNPIQDSAVQEQILLANLLAMTSPSPNPTTMSGNNPTGIFDNVTLSAVQQTHNPANSLLTNASLFQTAHTSELQTSPQVSQNTRIVVITSEQFNLLQTYFGSSGNAIPPSDHATLGNVDSRSDDVIMEDDLVDMARMAPEPVLGRKQTTPFIFERLVPRDPLTEPPNMLETIAMYDRPNLGRHPRADQYPSRFTYAMVVYCEDPFWTERTVPLPPNVRVPPRPYDYWDIREETTPPPEDYNWVPPAEAPPIPIPQEAYDLFYARRAEYLRQKAEKEERAKNNAK